MSDSFRGNMETVMRLEAAAQTIVNLPTLMADYYANGGDGVGRGVVMDRFSGAENGRFAPLSYEYFRYKQGERKKLNQAAKDKYGQGSKYVEVGYKAKGSVVGRAKDYGTNLPILVLSGKLKAAVGSRNHPISQVGETAIITFRDLPDYAEYLHDGTSKMPARSPVEPDNGDMMKVREYAERIVAGATGKGAAVSRFGQGTPRFV